MRGEFDMDYTGDRMGELLVKVDGYIRKFSARCAWKHFVGNKVDAVIEDATSSRGKMLRPRLLLLASGFGPKAGTAAERLCKLGAMVEMTHMASLIHDDIVDEATHRRGGLSLQNKYGKDAAVYAGDFLMSKISWYAIVEDLSRPATILARTVQRMCEGEIGQSVARYDTNVTKMTYLRNIHGKTAALTSAACRIGADESGCDRRIADRLARFGEHFGMMFQLRDDYLDFVSEEASTGKTAKKDFVRGIYTMPVLAALDGGGRDKLEPIIRANKDGTAGDSELETVVAVVREYGLQSTQRAITRWGERALGTLARLPESDSTPVMAAMVRSLLV
jgi:heptaprenyl diphosphate synthase